MPNFEQKDRDLLIKHDVKLTEMCKKVDKILDKIDDNTKTYITKRIFLSINGIIIALLITLFGYTASINNQVVENTVKIEHLENK
jgi:hypothetical protein